MVDITKYDAILQFSDFLQEVKDCDNTTISVKFPESIDTSCLNILNCICEDYKNNIELKKEYIPLMPEIIKLCKFLCMKHEIFDYLKTKVFILMETFVQKFSDLDEERKNILELASISVKNDNEVSEYIAIQVVKRILPFQVHYEEKCFKKCSVSTFKEAVEAVYCIKDLSIEYDDKIKTDCKRYHNTMCLCVCSCCTPKYVYDMIDAIYSIEATDYKKGIEYIAKSIEHLDLPITLSDIPIELIGTSTEINIFEIGIKIVAEALV
jgi:hypothetical protein